MKMNAFATLINRIVVRRRSNFADKIPIGITQHIRKSRERSFASHSNGSKRNYSFPRLANKCRIAIKGADAPPPRTSARARSTLRCNEALRIHAARLKHPRRTCVFSAAFVNTRGKRERIEESTRRVRAHSRRISFARLAVKSSPGASRASSLSRPLGVIFSLLSPPPLLILLPRSLLSSAACVLRRLRPTNSNGCSTVRDSRSPTRAARLCSMRERSLPVGRREDVPRLPTRSRTRN